jgi:hypothetical protein
MVNVAPKDRLAWANPGCLRCGGSGWSIVADDECRCVEDSIVYASLPDQLPRYVMSRARRERLEVEIRKTLVAARARFFGPSARLLASQASVGNLPPSVEKLAAFAHVDEAVASRVMDQIRGAIQTKKKGSRQ